MHGILVDKNGTCKETSLKQNTLEYFAQKCTFKNTKYFEERTIWKTKVGGNSYHISLYAKNEGRANNENKYDFPPPIDKDLYFGSCLLVNKEKGEICDLRLDEWNKIYEHLFGGFIDLSACAEEDENEEDELDDIEDEFKTKEGYLKDGFVIDDAIEDMDDDEYESELSEEPYIYSDED